MPSTQNRDRLRKSICALLITGFTCLAFGKSWVVDPIGTYPDLMSLRTLVDDGDTILIEAALYADHPQVSFAQSGLLIKGINGRPRLEAGNKLATNSNGKAILVLSGSDCIVENIEFANAAVPDHNGAGIRQEGCNLTVRYCFFNGNEMGLLGGNLSPCTVLVEHCIFRNNGSPANPGYQHNIYINHIDTFIFRYNYSVDAIADGHEVKSRAHVNIITYNHISNRNTKDSRNIDLPNGGVALIMGNLLEQGEASSNSNMLGFGMEGLTNRDPHALWVVNNTFVNYKTKGNFIQVKDGTDSLFVVNNILVGAKTGGLITGSSNWMDSSSNFVSDDISDAGFVYSHPTFYGLLPGSPCLNTGKLLNRRVGPYSLIPRHEYVDTANFKARIGDSRIDLGAFEAASTSSVVGRDIRTSVIYPNPVQGQSLFVRDHNGALVRFYTPDGRLVYSTLVRNDQVDLEILPKGIYLVEIQGNSMWLIRN